jgi:AbrB family looped-hinge helix DNA binding protein
VSATVAERTLVRVQAKGQVTLPAAVRRRLGLKEGDLVAVVATPDGVLITPQEVVATRALAEIGAALTERGLTLEELVERGRELRGGVLGERCGLGDPDPS